MRCQTCRMLLKDSNIKKGALGFMYCKNCGQGVNHATQEETSNEKVITNDALEELKKTAIDYANNGAYNDSYEACNKVLDHEPNNEKILLYKITVLHKMEKYDECAAIASYLLRLNPENGLAKVIRDDALKKYYFLNN